MEPILLRKEKRFAFFVSAFSFSFTFPLPLSWWWCWCVSPSFPSCSTSWLAFPVVSPASTSNPCGLSGKGGGVPSADTIRVRKRSSSSSSKGDWTWAWAFFSAWCFLTFLYAKYSNIFGLRFVQSGWFVLMNQRSMKNYMFSKLACLSSAARHARRLQLCAFSHTSFCRRRSCGNQISGRPHESFQPSPYPAQPPAKK